MFDAGLHHYYMGRTKLGIVYTFTGGLFGVGWLIDAFRMPCLVAKANAQLKLQRQTQAKVGPHCILC
jgi:hypothetical protein